MVPRVGCWIRQVHQDWFVRSGWLGDRAAGWAWGVGCCWVPAEDAGMTEEKAGSLGRPWDDGECWVPAEDAGMWFDSGPFDKLRAGSPTDSGPAHHERLGMGDGRKAGFLRGLRNDKGRDGAVSRIAGGFPETWLCGNTAWRCMAPAGSPPSMCGRLTPIHGRAWWLSRAGGRSPPRVWREKPGTPTR